MARPTKLNEARQRKIVAALRAGHTRAAAAAAAGISDETLSRWMKRGDEDKEKQEAGSPDSEFCGFCGQIRQAEAHAEGEALAAIFRSANGYEVLRVEETIGPEGTVTKRITTRENDWRAAAWFLEHGRCGPDWRPQQTISAGQLSDVQIISLLYAEGDE